MAETDSLIDTGLIVGLFNKRDQHHEWAKRQFARLSAPLYTCEAVISEAFHLLEDVPTGPERFLSALDRDDVFEVPFTYAEHAGPVRALMRTYADQPMSFADACLVRMAEERRRNPRVFTTDDDFHVYRTAAGDPLDVLAPAAG